jgi:hypothetical protein
MEPWEFQLRAEIAKTLEQFNMYGLGDYIPGTTHALIAIARKYAVYLCPRKHEGRLVVADSQAKQRTPPIIIEE